MLLIDTATATTPIAIATVTQYKGATSVVGCAMHLIKKRETQQEQMEQKKQRIAEVWARPGRLRACASHKPWRSHAAWLWETRRQARRAQRAGPAPGAGLACASLTGIGSQLRQCNL